MSLLTGHLSTPVIINTRHQVSFLLTAWLYGGDGGGGSGGGQGWSSSESNCFPPKWPDFKSWMRTNYYVSWVLLMVLVLAPWCFFQIHFQSALPPSNLIHNRRHRTMLLSATTKLLLLNTFFCSFLFPWSVYVTLDPQTRLFSTWREIMINNSKQNSKYKMQGFH